jgi:hypothetical protein
MYIIPLIFVIVPVAMSLQDGYGLAGCIFFVIIVGVVVAAKAAELYRGRTGTLRVTREDWLLIACIVALTLNVIALDLFIAFR